MARLKFGALVSQMSGSIGGSTLQRSSFGHSIRSKPLPIHSRKPLQLIRRSWMSEIQSAWSALTEIQRDLWRQFIAYSGQSINNDSNIQISGYNLFLKYQFCRKLCNLPLLEEFTYIPIPQWPQAFIFSNTSNQLFIQFDRVIADNEYFFILSVSNPRIPSRSYSPQNCRYMFCLRTGSDIFSFSETYIQNFGLLAQTGDTVHFSIYYFSLKAPLLSGFSTGKAIIGAQFPNIVNPIPPSTLLSFSSTDHAGIINIGGVIFADNRYLLYSALTSGYHIAYSSDGLSWFPSFFYSGLAILRAIFHPLHFVLLCFTSPYFYFWFSPDLLAWSFNPNPLTYATSYVVIAESVIYAFTFIYPDTSVYVISPVDPPSFLAVISPRFFSNPAYNSGLFVGVDIRQALPRFCYSSDMLSWSYSSFVVEGYPSDVIFGNGVYCCINSGSEGPFSWASVNGSVWSASTASYPLLSYILCFGDGYFWCHSNTADSSPVYKSVDGLNWLVVSTPFIYAARGIAAGAGRLVLAGGSPDPLIVSV